MEGKDDEVRGVLQDGQVFTKYLVSRAGGEVKR